MRKSLLAIACLGACAGAQAQSSVTLYGLIDTAVRYNNNGNAAGDNVVRLVDGMLSGTRWGIQGKEDLGGGLKAVFTLESGFVLDTGTSAQQGQLFGRQAFVGLESKAGAVTFGRQYGPAFLALCAFDPLGLGNAGGAGIAAGSSGSNGWDVVLTGSRFDNSIVYKGDFGGVSVNTMYALGEAAGNMRAGRTMGFNLGYGAGPLSGTVYAQQSQDAFLNKDVVAGFGGTYAFDPVKLYAGYVFSKKDNGFVTGANLSNTPLANTGLANVGNTPGGITIGKTTDRLYILGALFHAGPQINVTVGGMYDNASVGATAAGRETAYVVLDYILSKRTDVYTTLDFNKVTGVYAPGGLSATGGLGTSKDSQTGLAVGIRHRF